MFKHILVPTDGSASAEKAFRAALAFARETGAAITGYHAIAPQSAAAAGDGYLFPRLSNGVGNPLHAMQEAAGAAGVRFAVLVNEAADLADGLAAAMRASACDVVFIATHAVSPGVLASASVPVMAYR